MTTKDEGVMAATPKLTTRRADKPGTYAVLADGRDTGLTIEKSTPARWGDVQQWDVMEPAEDAFLFAAKGKAGALAILQTLADRLNPRREG